MVKDSKNSVKRAMCFVLPELRKALPRTVDAKNISSTRRSGSSAPSVIVGPNRWAAVSISRKYLLSPVVSAYSSAQQTPA